MKTLVVSTLALAAMTSVALAGAPAANKATAGPTKLTAAQMDRVSSGYIFLPPIVFGVGQLGAACGSQCGVTGVEFDF
jgi:hypothetical protein